MLKPQAEKSEEAKVNLKEEVKTVVETMSQETDSSQKAASSDEQEKKEEKTPCTCQTHINAVWERLKDMIPCTKGLTGLPDLASLPCSGGSCESGLDLDQCSVRAIAECKPKLENCDKAVEGKRCSEFDKMTKCPYYIEGKNSYAQCDYNFLLYSDTKELYCGIKTSGKNKRVPNSEKTCLVHRTCQPQEIQFSYIPILPGAGDRKSLITSEFGVRNREGAWNIHDGIDLTRHSGSLIRCVAKGTATSYTYSNGYGFRIVINHGAYETTYSHLAFPPTLGQLYPKGFAIALDQSKQGRLLSQGDEFVFRIEPYTLVNELYVIYLCSLNNIKEELERKEADTPKTPYRWDSKVAQNPDDQNKIWSKQAGFLDYAEQCKNYKSLLEVCKSNKFLDVKQLTELEKKQKIFGETDEFLEKSTRKIIGFVPFYQKTLGNNLSIPVCPGQVIGIMDGTSSGKRNVYSKPYAIHLHFEVKKGGKTYNPYHPFMESLH